MTTVAIFGGSFNPPHLAHVLAVTAVRVLEDIDEVVVIPTFRHPFAKPLAPFDERVELCRLAMGWIPGVSISRVEEELPGESRTLYTLEHLRKVHPDWSMRLVMGADILLEAHKWHRFDEVKRIAPPIVLGRIGISAAGAPLPVLPEISSTHVRQCIAEERWSEIEALVPRLVLARIREKGLYR
jgi:nicotinate-nucleotide adenylyltransferase